MNLQIPSCHFHQAKFGKIKRHVQGGAIKPPPAQLGLTEKKINLSLVSVQVF